jgi:CRP/FNR family transcriptional regulator, cyclic AMP receptor protein
MLRKDAKLELLKAVPLFSGCSKKELKQIERIADEIYFDEGKDLIREGSRGLEFFVLVNGTAEVRRGGRTIDSIAPGQFFGEMALVRDEPRNATVTTTSQVDILVITARDFKRLVGNNPLIALKVMRAVADRVPEEEFQNVSVERRS